MRSLEHCGQWVIIPILFFMEWLFTDDYSLPRSNVSRSTSSFPNALADCLFSSAGTETGMAYRDQVVAEFRSMIVEFRSMVVEFRSMVVEFRSMVVEFRSMVVEFRSMGVEFRSMVVEFRSMGVEFRRILFRALRLVSYSLAITIRFSESTKLFSYRRTDCFID